MKIEAIKWHPVFGRGAISIRRHIGCGSLCAQVGEALIQKSDRATRQYATLNGKRWVKLKRKHVPRDFAQAPTVARNHHWEGAGKRTKINALPRAKQTANSLSSTSRIWRPALRHRARYRYAPESTTRANHHSHFFFFFLAHSISSNAQSRMSVVPVQAL